MIDIIMIGLWCFTCMITLYSWFQLVNSPTLWFSQRKNLHLVRGFPSHVSLPEGISCYFTSGTSGSVPAFCFPTWAPYVHIYLRSSHLKRLNPNFWTRKSPMVVAWHPIWCYLNPTFLGSFVSTIHISYSKMCTLWTLEHIHLGKLYPWLGKLLFIIFLAGKLFSQRWYQILILIGICLILIGYIKPGWKISQWYASRIPEIQKPPLTRGGVEFIVRFCGGTGSPWQRWKMEKPSGLFWNHKNDGRGLNLPLF